MNNYMPSKGETVVITERYGDHDNRGLQPGDMITVDEAWRCLGKDPWLNLRAEGSDMHYTVRVRPVHITDFVKSDPDHQVGVIEGSFKLCQDSLEGGYWLVLESNGRKVVFSSDMVGPPDRERQVEEVEAHMTDVANDIEAWAHGSYSDLMAEAIRFLSKALPPETPETK